MSTARSISTFEMVGRAAQVNALRRTILEDLPVLACRPDDCIVSVNHSKLVSNEIIARRLAGVPIHSISPELIGGSVHLHVRNDSKTVRSVTSEQLEVRDGKGTLLPTAFRPHRFKLYDGTEFERYNLLLKLRPGEEIRLTCKISHVERCGESGLFCVAPTCSYWCLRDVHASEVAYEALAEEEKSLQRKMEWNTLEANRYVVPMHYMFTIESRIPLVYSNRQIIASACHVLIQNVESVVAVSTEKASETTIPGCSDIVLKNTGYTIGELLKDQIVASGAAKFITFFKKHPHDVHGILRLALKTEQPIKDFLASIIEPIKQYFLKIAEGQGQSPLHASLQKAFVAFQGSTLAEKQTRLRELGIPKHIVFGTDEAGLDGIARTYLNRVEQSVTPSLRNVSTKALAAAAVVEDSATKESEKDSATRESSVGKESEKDSATKESEKDAAKAKKVKKVKSADDL